MSLFKRLSGKLSEANSALSSASKEWRDESLTAREAGVSQREKAAAEKEAQTKARVRELRDLEARRGLRKFLYVLCAIAGAIPAFVIGVALGSTNTTPTAEASPRTATISKPLPETSKRQAAAPKTGRTRYSDPYTALKQGKYGSGNDTNVGYYCLDVEATGDATFEQCITAVALVLAGEN